MLLCAAPSYLQRHGVPRTPQDLASHACLGYLREGRPTEFRFATEGGAYSIEIGGMVHANDADVLRQLAIAGRGIIAIFDFLVTDALASGALVEVLADHPSSSSPIHALYPRNRHLLPKVAAFLEFLGEICDWDRPAERAAIPARPASKPRKRGPRRGTRSRR